MAPPLTASRNRQENVGVMVRLSHVGYIVFTSWTHLNVITSGKLDIFFKPRVSKLGVRQWKNVSDAMDAAKN